MSEELMNGGDGSVSFFNHVFNFDEDTKCQLMNLSQYAVTAIVPVLVLNKTIQNFVPEADDEKRSFEILAEVVGLVVLMFTSMFFIHRIISFIPNTLSTGTLSFSVSFTPIVCFTQYDNISIG